MFALDFLFCARHGHHQQRDDYREIADGVDEKTDAFAGRRDEQPRDRRAEQARPLNIELFSAIALERSSLRSIISATNACRAGASNALTKPWKALSMIDLRDGDSPLTARYARTAL